MPLINLFRAANFRLALLFALAVTASTLAVFVFIYWQFSILDLERIDVILSDEMARAVAEPLGTLRHDLSLRVTSDIRRVDYASLFDRKRHFVSGNFEVLPDALLSPNSLHGSRVLDIKLPDGETEPAVLIAGRRSDGSIVVIGRRLYEVYALRKLLVRALVMGLWPASALALVIGIIFSQRSARRLKEISQSIVRIMQGNLNERLPTAHRMDDINYVSTAVNSMLDEIVRLLDQLKSVGDNIAHDLRTPLAIVRAKLERAFAKGDDLVLRETVEKVLLDIDRAMTTIEALLRISEIESGRLEKNFTAVNLVEICQIVFELYFPLAETNSVEFRLEPSDPIYLRGDKELLVEAVANLVDNAIKFTPAGAQISIGAHCRNAIPTIEVSDRGCGIAIEDKMHIFKRFYRSSQHRRVPGNGLGLSMTATIAKLHGLEITVEDNHPGARFRLCANERDNYLIGEVESERAP